MDEKSKIYLFERKEVFLIFLLMLLIALTAFALGVRLGKNYTYNLEGFTSADRTKIELMSEVEEKHKEDLAKHSEKNMAPAAAASGVPVMNGKEASQEGVAKPKNAATEATYKALEEEFSKLSQTDKGPHPASAPSEAPKKVEVKVPAATPETPKNPLMNEAIDLSAETSVSTPKKVVEDKGTYQGKYTIQLGSHAGLEDAERFADGFRVRGYSPIINEVKIKERGTWYRVSLGVFESVLTAKDYIQKEQSLFKGTDYVIVLLE